MAWFKVDDGFWSHPKVLTLPASAGWLWLRAGTYSMQHLTDGVVLAPIIQMLGSVEDAEVLVDAGLWIRDGETFVFHDWAKYQPSKDDVESDRERNADRQRKWRDKQRESRDIDPVSNGERNALLTPSVTAPRPDPTRPSSKEDKSTANRGCRIPSDFEITSEMRSWAAKEVPLVDLDKRLPEFVDYWSGVAGAKGVKRDWLSTWRNGMRKQQEFAERDSLARPERKVKRFNDDLTA